MENLRMDREDSNSNDSVVLIEDDPSPPQSISTTSGTDTNDDKTSKDESSKSDLNGQEANDVRQSLELIRS